MMLNIPIRTPTTNNTFNFTGETFQPTTYHQEHGTSSIELVHVQVLVVFLIYHPDCTDADEQIDQFHIASCDCVVKRSCTLLIYVLALTGPSIHDGVFVIVSRVPGISSVREEECTFE